MDLFCEESDGEHMDKKHGHDETSENESADDGKDMDDGHSSDEDHDKDMANEMRKNRYFCRQARDMLHELNDYHRGDEHHRRNKAKEWGGSMHDAAWDFFGMDGAFSLTTYGTATVLATALAVTAF